MTKEEELARLIEDRDMAENELEYFNEELKRIEAEHDLYQDRTDWNYNMDECSAVENEIAYLNACIEELQMDVCAE